MVQTWQTGSAGKITCNNCEAVHELTEKRSPARDDFQVNCSWCGHLMKSGYSTSSYTAKMTSPGKVELKKQA